jgi:enterochelin esterase-like enzyme
MAAALLAMVVAGAGTEPADPPKGTLRRLEMDAPSVGESHRTVRVYLPPSYAAPESASKRYPVVYLLHGWPGSDGNLIEFGHANVTADSLIARREIPEIIMVFPNGGGSGTMGRSYWINGYDKTKRVEDYVAHDLVSWIDRTFRTIAKPSARALIGISEGADGAFNLCFKHPDLFSACGGHIGDYVFEKGFGTGGFLGPEPGASRILRENSPALYAHEMVPELRTMTIYFDTATGDESLAHNRAFHRTLDSLGVRHTYQEFPGGHTWQYWSRHLRESLLAVAPVLR